MQFWCTFKPACSFWKCNLHFNKVLKFTVFNLINSICSCTDSDSKLEEKNEHYTKYIILRPEKTHNGIHFSRRRWNQHIIWKLSVYFKISVKGVNFAIQLTWSNLFQYEKYVKITIKLNLSFWSVGRFYFSWFRCTATWSHIYFK